MVRLCLQYLFPNALLPFFVKVGEVRSAEVPPLEVIAVPLLAVLSHSLNLPRSMLPNARIIPVWADDHVLALITATLAWIAASSSASEFGPGMRATAAKASQMPCRNASPLAALLGIAMQGLLCLARVSTNH